MIHAEKIANSYLSITDMISEDELRLISDWTVINSWVDVQAFPNLSMFTNAGAALVRLFPSEGIDPCYGYINVPLEIILPERFMAFIHECPELDWDYASVLKITKLEGSKYKLEVSLLNSKNFLKKGKRTE